MSLLRFPPTVCMLLHAVSLSAHCLWMYLHGYKYCSKLAVFLLINWSSDWYVNATATIIGKPKLVRWSDVNVVHVSYSSIQTTSYVYSKVKEYVLTDTVKKMRSPTPIKQTTTQTWCKLALLLRRPLCCCCNDVMSRSGERLYQILTYNKVFWKDSWFDILHGRSQGAQIFGRKQTRVSCGNAKLVWSFVME